MFIQIIVVLLVTLTDAWTTCAEVLISVKLNSLSSGDDNKFLVIDLIDQLRVWDVICCLSVKP